ncbi:hypothetical protein CLE01_05520 [Cryobacterium levicorallinum]|nr:hypothetical protein CLE01_05520 [Cryobacterium levicorallinum]
MSSRRWLTGSSGGKVILSVSMKSQYYFAPTRDVKVPVLASAGAFAVSEHWGLGESVEDPGL